MIKFLEMEAENFFSVGKAHVDLDNRGLVLITGVNEDAGGSNGSGKTTVGCKLPFWTLYGRTPDDEGGDEVLTAGGRGTSTRTSITFRRVKDTYLVERSRSPNKVVLRQRQHDGIFHDISRRDSRHTEQLICRLLGKDLKAFTQTDFFGQGNNKPFLGMTPAEQTAVLENILPINKLSEWADKAKAESAKLSKLLTDKKLDLAKLEGKKESADRSLEDRIGEEQVWKAGKERTIKDIEKTLAECGEITSKFKAEIAEKKKDLPDVLLDEEDIEQLETNIATFDENIGYFNNEYNRRVAERRNCELQLTDLSATKCSFCGQDIAANYSEKNTFKKKELADKIAKLEEEEAHFFRRSKRARIEKDLTRQALGQNSHKLKKKSDLLWEIGQLEKKIAEYREDVYQEKLEATKAQNNPWLSSIADAKVQVKLLTDAIKEKTDELDKISKEKEIFDFWVKAFSKDFKAYLFNKACPYLEAQTNKHLRGLGNGQLQAFYSTAKLLKSGEEKFEFNAEIRSASGLSLYKSLSGGEKQMVNFAVGLALADLAETQVQGKSNLLILDEPFVCLDERNCENLVNYLTTEVTNKRDTIFLISNEENLKSLIPTRINIVKREGITSIKQN